MNPTPTAIARFATLPMPSPVDRVFGEIAVVFKPRKTFPGNRSCENFIIKDPDTGAEVEAGLWNRSDVDLLKDYSNGFIEIIATDSKDLVYKRIGDKPKGKLEIAESATVKLMRASEYPGWIAVKQSMGGATADKAIPFPAQQAEPHASIPARASAAAKAPGREAVHMEEPVDVEIRRLAAFCSRCLMDVHWALAIAKKAGVEQAATPEMFRELAITVCTQGMHDGVHLRMDLDSFLQKHDPIALADIYEKVPKPLLRQLISEIRPEHIGRALHILRTMGKLGPQQDLNSLSEEEARTLLDMSFPKMAAAG